MLINGNSEGVKKVFLEELESIYKIKVPKTEICSMDIIEKMCMVSSAIEREVSVSIDRKGNVKSVAVGDSTSVELPLLDIREGRLAGVRIIHTHPNGFCNLSALDLSALLKLKLDCIVAVGVYQNKIIDYSLGNLRVKDNTLLFEEKSHLSFEELVSVNILEEVRYLENLIKDNDIEEDTEEKAIVVGSDTRESLEELKELAKACNIPVLDSVYQGRNKIDVAFYIGRGKVLEIASLRQTERANLIIFDDELSGSQVRNLENALGAKVIDRTTLILEIFARRARSKEAKIQVELAQLKYRKGRLQGLGTVLSRTGGGIGTKGPGEKKLETDRRHIEEAIYDLKDELKKIKKTREIQREKRNKENIPKISLVGYTNAGKSTLRNALCEVAARKENNQKENVFEADMLFATLDTTTRAITLKNKGIATLTDTVGFVRKLPHDLEDAIEQIRAVEGVLEELGAKDKDTILVLNKVDKGTEEQLNKIKEEVSYEDIIEISAKEGLNLDKLLELIEEKLPYKYKKAEYMIPYSKGDVVSFLHRNGRILEEEYKDEGTYLVAEVDEEVYNKSKEYVINILS